MIELFWADSWFTWFTQNVWYGTISTSVSPFYLLCFTARKYSDGSTAGKNCCLKAGTIYNHIGKRGNCKPTIMWTSHLWGNTASHKYHCSWAVQPSFPLPSLHLKLQSRAYLLGIKPCWKYFQLISKVKMHRIGLTVTDITMAWKSAPHTSIFHSFVTCRLIDRSGELNILCQFRLS